jgi:TPR repeat protein
MMHWRNILASYFLCSVALATLSAELRAPAPSVGMARALAAQSGRVQAGSRSTVEFIADLRNVASTGDPVAQFLLATTLIAGTDKNQAISLLRSSAKAGCVGAIGALGVALAPNDPDQARQLIMDAATKGDTGSQLTLSSLYRGGGLGFKKSIPEAYAWATVAQNNAPTLSMRQIAASQTADITVNAVRSDIDRGMSRYLQMYREVRKQDFYLCGFSLP